MTAKPVVGLDAVAAFLAQHHGAEVDDVVALSGGFWSAAFAYTHAGNELVVRFGHNRDWYAVDRDAYAYSSDRLPVPRVVAIGDAFDGFVFAISERKHGVFLEDQSGDGLEAVVRSLLGGLRSASSQEVDYTWHDWLLGAIDPNGRNGPDLALARADAYAGPIAVRAETEVRRLLAVCPQRNDVVHGDLLHQNVLVAPDLSSVNAVLSWKCSARGDALFDAALLAFWGPWFPGIGALDTWSLADDGSRNAADRFRCYQLHIGVTHLGWYVKTNDPDGLRRVAERLDALA